VRSRPRRGPWRRLLTWILRIAGILIVSYLVVVNVLLRTRLLRNIISDPSSNFAILGNSSDLVLDYDSAYSIIPGRVHVEGLTIRGRERTVEWYLTLDHADVAINLFDLIHREFHATRLRSSGFSIRARVRLHQVDATPDVVAALPPIPGFADPPLLGDEPDSPALTDANYNLWMVDLEDVDVEHVREVWIHTVRAEGDTHVRGRWIFRPQRWLDVGPATVDANGVDISLGGHPLATGLHGSSGATVHPFDLRSVDGPAILDHVSYNCEMRGRADIAYALSLLAPRRGVAFTRWEGSLDANVVLDHGTFSDGTQVRIDAPDGRIDADGLAFEAPIDTQLGVVGDLGTIDTTISGLRVSHSGAELARAASVAATATSRRLQLAHGLFDDAHFTLDVGRAETNDVGAWKQFLPSTSTFVVRSGVVTADGHADGSLAERSARAEVRVSVRRLTVEQGSDRLTADVTSDAKLGEISLSDGWAAGAATIDANDVDARWGPVLLRGKLAAHVDLRRGAWKSRTFDLSGSGAAARTISVESARGGSPILTIPSLTVLAPRLVLAPSGPDGQVSIDLPNADLVGLGGLREMVRLPGGVAIEDGRGRARLHADVELASGSIRGDGEVVVRGVRARVGSTELFGDLDCLVRARRTGGARGWTDLSGSTVAITRAGSGSGPPPEDAWWGNATLREATLRTSGAVRFDAMVHLTAKDASPATALVAQNTAIPTWAANVFRMPVLDSDAHLLVSPSSVEVRSFVARGGNTSVRAEYAKRDGRQDGGVLASLGWIDLGYDLADGATGIVLFGPQSWFARKTATLRDAATAAKHQSDAEEALARYAAMTPGQRKDEASLLAARCTLDVRSCDGASIEELLRAAVDADERDALSGITSAPLVVAAAKAGKDGATLDPLVVGSVAEALRAGGESTLDDIPSFARFAPATGSDTARGKVIAVTGRTSGIRREGACSVGTLTTDAEPVYFVTPFAARADSETVTRFRGVFVQRYTPPNEPDGQPASLVLVGAFGP
jgi:hypothetical protein